MAQTTLSDYKNNLFSNHFLEERIQDRDEWKETDFEKKFDDLREFYQEKEGILTENLNEDQTQDNFINPILRKLGHDWVTEASKRVGSRTDGKTLNPDYAFMNSSEKLKVHQDDEDPLEIDYAVGDAKAWNRTLDKSSQDHTNPAFQIYNYVDRLRANWGILTNGKKWRLYSYEDCAADIYFEVDLENILAGEKTEEKLEAFKYFYLFFRAESFEEGFLDEVYQESVNFAEGLEEDLEDKVYNALEVAVEGFFETNDIEKTEENIDLVHHASLIFLYRILFILNAESRNLLPTDYAAYQQAFGLTKLKRMIVEEDTDDHLFQETTVAWDNRISRLFEGIDDGYDLNETEIPAYNGGLFDEENGETNKFLAENKLYGSYVKEILELLATSYDEEKEKRIILDYKDLNIRHLGSVYEGLLEHKFKAANQRKILKNEEWKDFSEDDNWEDYSEEKRVEENELYLTNESGERKATGSYYTPEYIVEYIVENTVGPKVEEKISEAEENGDNVLTKILELNVCDPAMGSGHFLTEATQYIAENIVEHADLKNQEIDENEDELNWAKRQVVQNCIYGVDINELAVELGKLSLWIETMAEGKPLNFLDHHLKHGNSLIGSDFDEIFSHPTEDQKRLDSERYQFGDPEEAKENFKEQYLEVEQMPENSVQQIHKKEEKYKEFISNNPLYQQFQQLANIHTRQYFEKEANSSDYESFLINIGNPGNPFEDTEWYKNAQKDAENRNYFHWQLEFPKVFFGQQEGFDAVIGNPPYIDSENMVENMPLVRDYLSDSYVYADGNWDMYCVFTELGVNQLTEDGKMGYIIPNKILAAEYAQKPRSELSKLQVEEVYDFSRVDVFDVDVYPVVLTIRNTDPKEPLNAIRMEKSKGGVSEKFRHNIDYSDIQELGSSSWTPILSESFETFKKIAGLKPREVEVDVSGGATVSEAYEIKEVLKDKSEEEVSSDGFKLVNTGVIESWYTEWGFEPTTYIKDQYLEPYVERDDLKEISENRVQQASESKIVLAGMGKELKGLVDEGDILAAKSTSLITSEKYELYNLAALLNSKVLSFTLVSLYQDLGLSGGYIAIGPPQIIEILARTVDEKLQALDSEEIQKYGKKIREKSIERLQVNTDIQDYLGNYSDGKTLGDLYTPAEGLSDKVVSYTSADRDSLRIGSVEFEERNGDLVLMVSARYKPDDSESIDEAELDRWGYFETEKVPAMKFNVDDKMRPLIEEFVSLAVDEAGGFAGFRESATKTNSVIDRLEKLTLPKLEDVEQGLEKFIENREEAEELEEEIQETDELIDAIVFDLYDLTEEEVETVLDSLDTEEDEKERILGKFGEI